MQDLLSSLRNENFVVQIKHIQNASKKSIDSTQAAMILYLLHLDYGVNIFEEGRKNEFKEYFYSRIVKEDEEAPFLVSSDKIQLFENQVKLFVSRYRIKRKPSPDTIAKYLNRESYFNLKKLPEYTLDKTIGDLSQLVKDLNISSEATKLLDLLK